MISLTVEAEDGEADLLGKHAGDLQEDIVVGSDSISGTLKYVTEYTGFSGDPDLQQGNYIALKFDAPEGATTTVEIVGGFFGPVTLDEDMIFVGRIADTTTQSIRVVCTKDSYSVTRTFSLVNLSTLGPEDNVENNG